MFPEPSLDVAAAAPVPAQPARHLTRWRAAAEVLMCSGYPTQLAIVGVLNSMGVPPLVNGSLSPQFVFAISVIDTAILIGLVIAFLKLSDERPRDVFLGVRNPVREASLGLLLVPVLFVIVASIQLIIRTFAPHLHNVPVNPFESFLSSPAMRAAFMGLVVVAGGVREELQRAFLVHRFEQRLGGAQVGVVVTSVAFGFGHTLQGLDAAIVTASLGAFWAMIYLARRSVAANVVSHATFNVLQVLAGLSSVARA